MRAWLEELSSARLPGDLSAPEALIRRCVEAGVLAGPQSEPPPPPSDTLVAWLHVTNRCNLRCVYCYVEKNAETMDLATGRAAVEKIVQAAHQHGYRAFRLKYAGGEASLNLPLVCELHQHAQALAEAWGLEYRGVLLSNGVGLSRTRLRMIGMLGLRLMISLDGVGAIHDAQRVFANGRGSFTAVERTVERARELGLDPLLAITVTGRTAANLATTVEWALERDLRFSLNFYREHQRSQSHHELQLDELRLIDGMLAAYRVIEEHLPEQSLLGALVDRANLAVPHGSPCGVGESYLVVDQRGRIARCQMELERPLTTIKAEDPLGEIRADQGGARHIPVELRESCRDCSWRHWCAGGCPAMTFRATGRYDHPSPNCRIYQALFPAALRLEGLRLIKYGRPERYSLH